MFGAKFISISPTFKNDNKTLILLAKSKLKSRFYLCSEQKKTSRNFFLKVCINDIDFYKSDAIGSCPKTYKSNYLDSLIAACAAASLAIGTRKGEQDT